MSECMLLGFCFFFFNKTKQTKKQQHCFDSVSLVPTHDAHKAISSILTSFFFVSFVCVWCVGGGGGHLK